MSIKYPVAGFYAKFLLNFLNSVSKRKKKKRDKERRKKLEQKLAERVRFLATLKQFCASRVYILTKFTYCDCIITAIQVINILDL